MPLRRSTPPVAAPCTAGAIHTGKATREWKCGTRGLGGGEPGPVPRICKFLGRLSSFCHARVQCSYTVIGVHAFRKLCYLSNEDAGTRIRGVPPRVPPPGGPGPGAPAAIRGRRAALTRWWVSAAARRAGGAGRRAGRAGSAPAARAFRISFVRDAEPSRERPPPTALRRRASGRATRRERSRDPARAPLAVRFPVVR